MKHLTIFISLIVLIISTSDAALFTRLYFTNADCSGFHVAYNFMNSADAPTTCASGCTEWYSGQFWVKEVCDTRVSPLYQEGFSVVRISPGDTCNSDYSEFGAIAEMCIVWQKTPTLQSIRLRTCPGGADQKLIQTGYSGGGCALESSTKGFNRNCTYNMYDLKSYEVPQCPLATLPPAAPIAPPVDGPVATSTPNSGSNSPSIGGTPSSVNQPASSTTKASGATSTTVNVLTAGAIVILGMY